MYLVDDFLLWTDAPPAKRVVTFETPSVVDANLAFYGAASVSTACGSATLSSPALVLPRGANSVMLLPTSFTAAGGSVSFSVRSCGAAALTDAGGVVVRYSLNGGATWTTAAEQAFGFALSNTQMKRVNVGLPNAALGSNVLLAIVPLDSMTADVWAIDDVRIGVACANGCSNRGYCEAGVCTCDPGSSGADCGTIAAPLPNFLRDELRTGVTSSFSELGGVSIAASCGSLDGNGALLFNRNGPVRRATTQPLDLSAGGTVQFYAGLST